MESKSKYRNEQIAAKYDVINVGSRKSRLALIQTNLVIDKLKNFYSNNPDQLAHLHYSKDYELKFNLVSMTTTGDRVLDKPLPAIGTKSLFTRELEIELIEGRVDFVVHSLKDLPTTLPEGCTIGAIMERDSKDDAIILKKSLRSRVKPLDLLLGKATEASMFKFKIGTSSQRRIAMTKRCNPDLDCIDIRGNLNTRLSKLDNEDGEYSAIILAKAGLDRMGWSERASSLLIPENDPGLADWCYAVGQGAIAIECRSNDCHILELLNPIIDLQTTFEVIAERSLMKKLEGGCSVPLGVRSTWTKKEDEEFLNLESVVLSIDGKSVVKATGKTMLSSQKGKKSTSVTPDLELLTTGVNLSRIFLSSPNVKQGIIECSKLGVEVANKMIDLGCLELMSRGK